MQRIVKPKLMRTKRALEKREPKAIENTKTAFFVRGSNTSDVINNALKELYLLKKPHAVMFNKKNPVRPFEDINPLEFFSQKNDAALFVFGSHNKKRPHNLVIGHMFDHHLLDMLEFGIENYKAMSEFQTTKCTMGNKPCLVFAGDLFESDHTYKRLKILLIDFFRGPVVSKVRLAGLEHVLSFTTVDGKILMRSYKILLKKSGSRTPRVELEEIGPSMDLTIRRTHLASADLYKRSLKVPKVLKPTKKKNISKDVFRTTHGRVHMQKQNLGQLQTRKMKGLKRTKPQEINKRKKKQKKERN